MTGIFDKDLWVEVWFTVRQQKMRSLMTMFGVFWGIFMLVILVGCGFGMNNGVLGKLTSLATNTIFILPNKTTMPYNGLDRDREWKISEKDIDDIKKKFANHLDFITLVSTEQSVNVTYEGQSGQYQLGGISPTFIQTIPQQVVSGRYINDIDVLDSRKVCIIGQQVAEELFGDENPCNKPLNIDNNIYTIVGVVKQTNNMLGVGLPPTKSVILPITTYQAAYNRVGKHDLIAITFLEDSPITEYTDAIYSLVKKNNIIHPADTNAADIFNVGEAVQGFHGLKTGIFLLIWIIGIGTLMAGLIGITNIMMVTVKERTQEIGVRRALGAMPEAIIRQIMSESLVLTFTAGVTGIVAGVWLLALLNNMMQGGGDLTLIERPMIPILPTLLALVVLIIGGLAAGYVPASRALKIKAIEALRED